MKKRDLFLSYSSKDRNEYVIPYKKELDKRGISYWLYEEETKQGDNYIAKINEGFKNSYYVVVFISSNFLESEHAKTELSVALSMEYDSGIVKVLPILINDVLNKKDIIKQYPLLSNKQFVIWNNNIHSIVDELSFRLNSIESLEEEMQSNTKSNEELFAELNSCHFLLPALKKLNLSNQIELSLHNKLAVILLGKYDVSVEAKQRGNALQKLKGLLEKDSLKNLFDDLIITKWSINELHNIIDNIQKIINDGIDDSKSTTMMSDTINDFYKLCYGLYVIGENNLEVFVKNSLSGTENMYNEFKSTLIWSIYEKKKTFEVKHAIAKTIAAFMNTGGGTLLIGVDDGGNPIGLDYDLNCLGNSNDKFLRSFGDIVENMIGITFNNYIKDNFVNINNKIIFSVQVSKSKKLAYVTYKDTVELFVRSRAKTIKLNVKEAIDYYVDNYLH